MKFSLEICMGSACYLMGAQDLLEVIERLPEEKRAKIDVKGATCLKACGSGPNVKLDGALISNVTPEILSALIEEKLQS